jgi:hypothetical protein
MNRRLRAAQFREVKTLEDFDFAFNPSIKKKQIYDLATCRFVHETRDVLLLGPPNNGSEIADRFGHLAFYRMFFGPAGQQLTTTPDAVTRALLPSPTYPLGVIAGNRSVYPIASRFLPSPNDGRVSVESTKLNGMADHIVIPTAHPLLVRDARAIAQTITFLQRGRFNAAA